MKIIITGITGFVGRNLQNYLNTKYDIAPLSVRYKREQIFDLDAQVVIHLAGKAHDLKNCAVPQDYYEANFELTKQLFDSFLKSKSQVFIFLSTVKAVADYTEGILDESSSADPKTHYGIAKRHAEQYILGASIPANKRVYVLRPCMIHGPGNKGNLNLLYKVVSYGLPWPLGGFNNRRSFLSVENLCFIIRSLIENESVASGIYHLADDKALSTNDLIRLIGQSQNKKIKLWNIPAKWVKFIAVIGDKLHLPFNSERLVKLTENYTVSNKKILQNLGVSLPVSAEIGLLKTFESFNSSNR